MRYRRDEAFRFEFGEPLPIVFTIEEMNGSHVETSDGKASLLDISLRGMKICTSLSIPIDRQSNVKVSIQFQLNHNNYTIQGIIVWKKQRFTEYFYGIQFTTSSETQDALLDDLKIIGKRMA
ncbi:PilZ domain-containing protein [Ornithinibacillus xuwenensis]|uniref:PilZ domain-containing protein n=1 Tax=Ornithinibacillus xuwenensis TaxID=3144668 RepID=A0ABU9XK86_9BACI